MTATEKDIGNWGRGGEVGEEVGKGEGGGGEGNGGGCARPVRNKLQSLVAGEVRVGPTGGAESWYLHKLFGVSRERLRMQLREQRILIPKNTHYQITVTNNSVLH